MFKIMDKNYHHDYHAYNFSSTSTSPSSTPSTANEVVAGDTTRLYRARLILENHLYDQLLGQYRLAITRLRELTREANSLQEENQWLRWANGDLFRQLNRLFSSSSDQSVGPTGSDQRDIVGSNSPTSVMDDNNNNGERFSLPKSISIRSPRYFKLINPSPPPPVVTSNESQISSQHINGRKLRVGREKEAVVEMEVFNQGMYKTELCNKWQETGTCPYGPHCQYAHGLPELRPVIRHPRYKTQVCRMVLAGVTCPYGHRCHFRHASSPNHCHHHRT